MSTANAFMIACGTIISADLIKPVLTAHNRGLSQEEIDRKCLLGSKIGAVVIVVLTVLFSMTRSMFITDYAYSLSTPGFAQIIPAFLFGLFWKRPSKAAAISGTVAGFVTVILTTFVIPAPFGIHQIIWSLGLNTAVYFIVSFAVRPSREVVENMFAEA